MIIRYYIDPETGLPHIHNHEVREDEVDDVLRKPGEERPGKENSRIAIRQTKGGRYLRLIYVPDPEPDSVFVITAYELIGKPVSVHRFWVQRFRVDLLAGDKHFRCPRSYLAVTVGMWE